MKRETFKLFRTRNLSVHLIPNNQSSGQSSLWVNLVFGIVHSACEFKKKLHKGLDYIWLVVVQFVLISYVGQNFIWYSLIPYQLIVYIAKILCLINDHNIIITSSFYWSGLFEKRVNLTLELHLVFVSCRELSSSTCIILAYNQNIARVRNCPVVIISNTIFGLCLSFWPFSFCLFVFLSYITLIKCLKGSQV